ncbi:hypothetical protein KUD11_09925 [Roseovarius sp. LXJ103]|uniref:hypothetical protein n=1 Tax=Roseovarius carneus TaxID=2853164 RepID=UPI000D60D287|nr:hypothetical protein [Roseovarius carneus]MBZ8118964.1 hypothetical protein [Roseovarius carneus]PWE35381.1 hypothetical protein DD563_05025 [Pelagicola sp. LXJ1103]
MQDKPDFIISGDHARLFPVLAETSKERRVASIFLAVMSQIPALSEDLLGSVGVRSGKRTKVRTFTEVVLKVETASGCRPDGLIVVDTGRTQWTALVEAKIGKNDLGDEQVQKYVELAKANGLNAVITISNQFVARADHSPVNVPKTLLRKVDLFHWSWARLATLCEILAYQEAVDDQEQLYLLEQFNDFLAHPATGVERFTQMAAPWKDVCQAVTNDETLKKSAPEVEAVAGSWLAEERDLCLHMSSYVGQQVEARIPRKHIDDPAVRLKSEIDKLVSKHLLDSTFRIPNCASDIDVCADLARRTVSVSMTVKARADRVSTKARVNWLLGMLPDDDDRLLVRAHWPGSGSPTMKEVVALRKDPASIQSTNPESAPHSFEVLLVERLGARFSGRKTFIEDLERIVTTFYDLVGSRLKAWQAPPPQAIKSRSDPSPGELEMDDLQEGGALPEAR